MEFVRSSLITAIVSLLVLTGYAYDLFGDCDGRSRAEHTAALHASGESSKEFPPHNGHDCKCLCHQVFSNAVVEPIRVGQLRSATEIRFVAHSEFPPDAGPHGIDHPPQLV